MKALSLWQPWASLVAFEEKKVETRIWTTKYRGWLAIASTATEPARHLGRSRTLAPFHQLFVEISQRHGWGEWYWPEGIPQLPHTCGLGAILCFAELVDIRETRDVRNDLSVQEVTFGNYEDGRYAWFFDKIIRLDTPIPVKGNRMLWNWIPTDKYLPTANGRMFNTVDLRIA